MTNRDTLTPWDGDTLAPIRKVTDEINASVAAEIAKLERPRHRGIIAAEFYVDSASYPCDRDPWVDPPPGWTLPDERTVPPPSPWSSVLAVVLIFALVVVALWGGMAWWQATLVGVVMSAGACLAWGGVIAEAGRDAGVVR